MFCKSLFKFCRVNVAFERNFKLCILCFVNSTVKGSCLSSFNMSFCCIEM